MSSSSQQASARNMEPIAIVGMSCTLAGGVDRPAKLWETLVNKKIQQSAKIPESRFNIDAYFREDAFGRPAAIGSKGGFFLETDLHAFDAGFFGYEADEAKHMDPQHFRVLESVYECLESAGRTLEDVKGTNTAVYIGNFSLDQVVKSARNSYDDRHLHEVIGVDPGLLSSRVSYCYDMNGPVYTTNTGCTSSLFALHTAAMALRGGECTSAIVGGVNLLQGPEAYSAYSKFGIMSPDSMCHSFDARCNGYCRAEGVGTLLVRRLSHAIRDGDPIRGVIRSIAVNSNGYVPGLPLFVPNQKGLEQSMKLAYTQSGLDPAETAYVESHGIGMIIGEIAEQNAIGTFYNSQKKRDKPVMMGSLKPNFGHQEAGSGIFVLIKASLMTERGEIPAHADFESPHPAVDMVKLNIKPQTENIPWPEEYSTRRVALNSYGWSGTNAHILVESVDGLNPGYAPQAKLRSSDNSEHTTSRPQLIVFSAGNEGSLQKNIANLAGVVDDYYLADLAYTLNVRRSKLKQRAFVVTTDGKLAEAMTSSIRTGVVPQEPVKIALAFADADLRPLAAELAKSYSDFAKTVEQVEGMLKEAGETVSLAAYIFSQDARSNALDLALQLAVIDFLAQLDIKPDVAASSTGADLATSYAIGKVTAAEAIKQFISKPLDHFDRDPAADSESAKPDVTITIGGTSEGSLSITSVSDLLNVAGELFLRGRAVDLAKINETGAEWKPSLVLDLPPYAWDHSQSYSAESHANKEHRTNKHPYHDLLGRRVFGLGPQTMVWKNKLSFRDLPKSIPWIPNPKPKTVVAIEQFLPMIAEALSQAFEGKDLNDFAVEDIKVQKPLEYADDVDLIELQTSITKLPGRDNAYGASFQSVKDGVWTTHCEGTLIVADKSSSVSQDTNKEQWASYQLQMVEGKA